MIKSDFMRSFFLFVTVILHNFIMAPNVSARLQRVRLPYANQLCNFKTSQILTIANVSILQYSRNACL